MYIIVILTFHVFRLTKLCATYKNINQNKAIFASLLHEIFIILICFFFLPIFEMALLVPEMLSLAFDSYSINSATLSNTNTFKCEHTHTPTPTLFNARSGVSLSVYIILVSACERELIFAIFYISFYVSRLTSVSVSCLFYFCFEVVFFLV